MLLARKKKNRKSNLQNAKKPGGRITWENLAAQLDKMKEVPEEAVPCTLGEEKFCRLYMKSLNKTDAYRKAYPNSNNPQVQGSQMTKRPRVLLRLAQLWQVEKKRLQLDMNGVLEELVRLATVDVRDFLDFPEKGMPVLKKDFDGKAVKSVEPKFDKDGDFAGYSVTFWNKDKAIENLGRYYKLFTDNSDVNVSGEVQVFKIGGQEITF